MDKISIPTALLMKYAAQILLSGSPSVEVAISDDKTLSLTGNASDQSLTIGSWDPGDTVRQFQSADDTAPFPVTLRDLFLLEGILDNARLSIQDELRSGELSEFERVSERDLLRQTAKFHNRLLRFFADNGIKRVQ